MNNAASQNLVKKLSPCGNVGQHLGVQVGTAWPKLLQHRLTRIGVNQHKAASIDQRVVVMRVHLVCSILDWQVRLCGLGDGFYVWFKVCFIV